MLGAAPVLHTDKRPRNLSICRPQLSPLQRMHGPLPFALPVGSVIAPASKRAHNFPKHLKAEPKKTYREIGMRRLQEFARGLHAGDSPDTSDRQGRGRLSKRARTVPQDATCIAQEVSASGNIQTNFLTRLHGDRRPHPLLRRARNTLPHTQRNSAPAGRGMKTRAGAADSLERKICAARCQLQPLPVRWSEALADCLGVWRGQKSSPPHLVQWHANMTRHELVLLVNQLIA